MKRTLPPLLVTLLCISASSAAHAQFFGETPHTMIVTSDPQYPWTDVTDRNGNQPDTEKEAHSRDLIRQQYESIANYRRARPHLNIPVIINGDLTAYGHGWQRSVMNDMYKILGDNYYLGLGNHDYANNVKPPEGGSRGCANNGCARDSLDGLRDHVRSRKVLSFDFADRTGAFGGTFEGSYAYAFEAPGFERVVNFQLNNYPTYKLSFTTNKTFNYHFNITPSVRWLSEVLPKVSANTRDYDFAIVHVHQPTWPANADDVFRDLMANNKVPVAFAGHYHGTLGRHFYTSNFGQVPVFLSGSASQRTYLIVEHYPRAGLLRVFGVRNNDPENKQLMEEIRVPGHG
ncbi:hypothetical protein FHW69_000247 [Luteibacter sp. Sphag1AF]|uniref:metallophosphoesterase n=1 Tax=Luteibacter sp. Sphag1AF TaxID=2587031 RepID=UPI001619ACB7|nr:metallophosphoesterase [Luteibacter sp. Sphag1AF]MBB3225657.1 hypothetical protein [Luteibacter sp. Sphag1AF]